MEIKQEFQRVNSPENMAKALRAIFAEQHPFDQTKEQFFVVGMNTKHVIRYIDMISMGTLDASLVHPRETFRHAVTFGVAAIGLAHNHPSGDVSPSREDIEVTRRMIDAGNVLGVRVVEHLIVGTGTDQFQSLRESHPDLDWSR